MAISLIFDIIAGHPRVETWQNRLSVASSVNGNMKETMMFESATKEMKSCEPHDAGDSSILLLNSSGSFLISSITSSAASNSSEGGRLSCWTVRTPRSAASRA